MALLSTADDKSDLQLDMSTGLKFERWLSGKMLSGVRDAETSKDGHTVCRRDAPAVTDAVGIVGHCAAPYTCMRETRNDGTCYDQRYRGKFSSSEKTNTAQIIHLNCRMKLIDRKQFLTLPRLVLRFVWPIILGMPY